MFPKGKKSKPNGWAIEFFLVFYKLTTDDLSQ